MASTLLIDGADQPRRLPREIGRVLFVDGDLWEPFGQLAAALRPFGIASDHITAKPRNWRGWVSQRLEQVLFERTANEVQRGLGDGGPARVDPHRVAAWITAETLDVQARDDLGALLLTDPLTVATPLCHTTALRQPAAIYDKWAITRLAQMCGVPVPLTWRTHDDPPVNGPVILKSPVGFGGQGTVLVTDEQQWPSAVAKVHELGWGEPFAQQYVGTRTINVAGVAVRGYLLLAACYEQLPRPDDPFGPAVNIRLTTHEGALDAAARLVEATGFHGMFCIDFVRDESDRALFIDFNPRVFGSWGALQELGYDFVGAYLHTLGIGPGPRWRRTYGASQASTLGAPPAAGSLGRWLTTRWATIRQQQPYAGAGWARTTRARTLALAAQASAQRFTGRT